MPRRAERAYPCPECGTWMEVRPNPHYGVGLAVHPYLIVCGKCGWTNFVPAVPVGALPGERPRGLVARFLGRWVRHPKR